ncbi:hypothetical protein KY314_00230 [Candidatus Woesearchaeota archaeon]|nr:hypothetical protein [Candidatus Woesearchaeota archaeon]
MTKDTQKSASGRPSVEENEEKQAEYIKIWTAYNYFSRPQWEIAKMFNVSKSTVSRALEWVSKNLIEVPPKALLDGAIFSIRKRIEALTDLLEKEKKRNEPSIRNVKELNAEIRAEQTLLLKLQEMYEEKYNLSGDLTVTNVLDALSKKQK